MYVSMSDDNFRKPWRSYLHIRVKSVYKDHQVKVKVKFAGCSALVPRRRPLPDGKRRGSTSSAFGLVTVSGCAPYAAVDVPRPSFPGCRLASLEQSATSRHVCTVFSALVWRLISSAAVFVDYIVVPVKWHSLLRTHKSLFLLTYLLTYLLTGAKKVENSHSRTVKFDRP